MNAFFSLLNQLFDLFFWPFRNVSPIWPVLVFSLPTAVFMLLVFRHFSNQSAIRRAKDRIGAHLLEVRLYQDQLGVVLRAYGRLLRATGVYILYSLKPLAVLLLPLLLLMAQMELRLGHEPLRAGNAFLIQANFDFKPSGLEDVVLELPEGLEQTAPLLINRWELNWRVVAHRSGTFAAVIKRGAQSERKEIVVGDGLQRASPVRSLFTPALLLYPGEPSLEGAVVTLRSVSVQYPLRETSLLGWGTHWLIPFFVLTLVFGYALKGVMGAEF